MDLVSSSESLIDDLLEDYWFFENLFTRRSRVLRCCHSDPYPSSSSLSSPEKMGDSELRKTLEASTVRCLTRETSIDRREGGSEIKQFSEKIRLQEPRQVRSFLQKKVSMVLPKSGSRSAPGKIQEACLIRTPSLPPRIDKREASSDAKKMINKLTRQFSEKIRVLEPRRPSGSFLEKKETMVKGKEIISEMNRTRDSSSVKISLQRTQTMPSNIRRKIDNEEDEFEDQETDSRMGFLIREALASSQNVPKVLINQRHRPPRNLRFEEDTVMVKQGIGSSPKTLRKTLSSIETTKDYDQLIEPRVATGLMATPPRVPKDSRKEVKDQIKFWARAVASNVRQEC
ncbi:hypothetical protein AALP_AA4G030300 [Arabis alpina]|uniref:Uncharacterized protein n=1 Tax=Arabis alpina TaxID=50452 RepID=A0A087H0T7_ARAAL|nr:hypothetical protein AALP_AA4G030300 [Arabis alpina]